jgi:alpha-tubulin suppressor-like RCC1 family protein
MRTLSFVSLAVLALTSCGGGGDNAAPAPIPTPAPSPIGTVQLNLPADGKAQWNFTTPVSITLKDAIGNIVAKPSCAAADTVAVTIAPDCTSVTGNRVGVQTITASGGGVSQTFTIKVIPQKQVIATNVASSQGSGDYNMVVTPQGKVLGWGANVIGSLGQNVDGITFPFSALPIPVKDELGTGELSNIVAASAGDVHALALNEDGEVLSWGRDALGRVTQNASYLPGKVRNAANTGNLGHIVAVGAGDLISVGLADDGTVYSWGSYTGQGTSNSSQFPNQVKDAAGTGILQNIVAISAGSNQTLALTRDGKTYAWGYNNKGIAGVPVTTSVSNLPTLISKVDGLELTNIVSISAGYNHNLVLAADGSVFGWGDNSSGQLGISSQTNTGNHLATQVKGLLGTGVLGGIASVSAGGNSSFASDSNGNVFSWGLATSGQLGDGPNRPAGNTRPSPNVLVSAAGTGQLTGVIGVASGYLHGLALMPDGNVVIWGDGFRGNLGQGNTSNASGSWPNSPVPLTVKDQAGTGSLNLGPLTVTRDTYRRFR